MAEESGQPAANGEQGPPLVVNAQYIKDLSFEVPGAPQMYAHLDEAPSVAVNVDVEARPIAESSYEVILQIGAEGTFKGERAFVVELSYGGVFTLSGIPQDRIQPLILIECPRLLFPFARNIVADMTRDGGFPPLMIAPIDFVALYLQKYGNPQDLAGGNGETGTA
ncbi:MAG: protein-export chaperone SecB [Acetobacterales bacterium]